MVFELRKSLTYVLWRRCVEPACANNFFIVNNREYGVSLTNDSDTTKNKTILIIKLKRNASVSSDTRFGYETASGPILQDSERILNHIFRSIHVLSQAGIWSVIPANFSFSQSMPFSMKKLIFNDFFCRTGIKIPAKPDKKSTKKIFKKPRKPLNNLMKKN